METVRGMGRGLSSGGESGMWRTALLKAVVVVVVVMAVMAAVANTHPQLNTEGPGVFGFGGGAAASHQQSSVLPPLSDSPAHLSPLNTPQDAWLLVKGTKGATVGGSDGWLSQRHPQASPMIGECAPPPLHQ
ncbi:hypothetical protein O3P69_006057 [Scylla paramamosain]|uniref:Uncharacterized protein n=1 Tax=Scylla paramamosain TaxID=85552 RepID=A0AAW0U6M3_SCYPA